MIMNEAYGLMTESLARTIKRCNVSPADYDTMLARWGMKWSDNDLPYSEIERHILVHSQNGSYYYPLYGD